MRQYDKFLQVTHLALGLRNTRAELPIVVATVIDCCVVIRYCYCRTRNNTDLFNCHIPLYLAVITTASAQPLFILDTALCYPLKPHPPSHLRRRSYHSRPVYQPSHSSEGSNQNDKRTRAIGHLQSIRQHHGQVTIRQAPSRAKTRHLRMSTPRGRRPQNHPRQDLEQVPQIAHQVSDPQTNEIGLSAEKPARDPSHLQRSLPRNRRRCLRGEQLVDFRALRG